MPTIQGGVYNFSELGIGTSSPNRPLEVAVSGTSTTSYIRLTGTNSNGDASSQAEIAAFQGTGLTDSRLAFRTRASGTLGDRVTINESGNVGIGTTSPDAKFHTVDNTSAAVFSTTEAVNRILLADSTGSTTEGSGYAIDFAGVYGALARIAVGKANSSTSGGARDFGRFSIYLNADSANDSYNALVNVFDIGSGGDVTLGPSSAGGTHIFQAGVGVSTRVVNINNTASGAVQTVVNYQTEGTSRGFIGADTTNAFKVLNAAGNQSTPLITCTDAGAVTLGPAVTNNYNALPHTINGGIKAGNVTSTDESGLLNISVNCRISGAASRSTRSNTVTTGAAIELDNRITDTQSIRFYCNQVGDSTTTAADLVGHITAAGAWTLGPSGGGVRLTNNGFINLARTTQSISGGNISITSSYMTIDTEGAASTDNLDTISGGTPGDIVVLETASSTRDVTLRQETGAVAANRFNLPGGTPITLGSVVQKVTLMYSAASRWHVISQT